MNASNAILEFLKAIGRCMDLLRSEHLGVQREAGRGLKAYPRDGGPAKREGTLGAEGEFSLHGVGCYFKLATGEVVDVDWNAEGHVVFDLHRLTLHMRSLPGGEVFTDGELRDAADWLVSAGELAKLENGWYVAEHLSLCSS